MDGGRSNSAFNLKSYLLSVLQFLLVQKYSQIVFAKAMVEIGCQGFLDVRTTVVNENIVDIVVVFATI
jgi:hypothetical protein